MKPDDRSVPRACAAIVMFTLFVASCSPRTPRNDWMELFNGRDLDGWIAKIHHHEVGANAHNTFRAGEGMIQVRYDRYGDFNDQFGHLFFNRSFSAFHLVLEYQFTGELQRGAPGYTLLNSGVMFHSQDPRTILREQNWPISVEMQFLAELPDGTPRATGNMCSPGTEIEYQGSVYPEHCLSSSSRSFKKDEWVRAELIVLKDSRVFHVINGDTVLKYSRPTMGGGVVDGQDSTIWKPGTRLTQGFIGLQSEGQPINFRNIRIRELE